MMPVYPGAPWLPKFEGTGDDVKYTEWKEQIGGLLGVQELTEAKKVAIILGALSGEAKRQVNVLEEEERDTAPKVFTYLDSLYGDKTPTAVLRAQFFSCVQHPSESVPSFLLRLRELHCRLRRHDPDDHPSAASLRDRLLLGLRESPLAQALRVHARHHPEEDFAALRQEALLLDGEYAQSQSEVTCSAVNNSSVPPKQEAGWRETLRQEIMEDVKSQMKTLTQELMREIRPLLRSPATDVPPPIQVRRESPRPSFYTNERDERGRPICRQCRRAGHIARFCTGPMGSQPNLN